MWCWISSLLQDLAWEWICSPGNGYIPVCQRDSLYVHLMRVKEDYRLELRKIRFDRHMLRQIIQNGVLRFPELSHCHSQRVCNSPTSMHLQPTMAGCGAYSKVEGLPSAGDLLYYGDNYLCDESWAKQYDRAKKGAKSGILCSISIAELIGITIYTAAPVLIAAFNRDPDVIHYGVMQARTIALFYCLLAFTHCIAAVLRGSGNAAVPMIVLLCVWCLFRVSYITLAVRLIPDIRVIFWAYPLTWSISSVIFLFLFLRGNWVHGFEKKVTGR